MNIKLIFIVAAFLNASLVFGEKSQYTEDTHDISRIDSIKIVSNKPEALGHPLTIEIQGEHFTNNPDKKPLFDVSLLSYEKKEKTLVRTYSLKLRELKTSKRVTIGGMGSLFKVGAKFNAHLEFAVYEFAQGREKDITILEFEVDDKIKKITATYDVEKEQWTLSKP